MRGEHRFGPVTVPPADADYSALQSFLRSYFHEDWYDVYDVPPQRVTTKVVVEYFVEHEQRERVSGVLRDLRRLLERGLPELELRDMLTRRLHSSYYPWLDTRPAAARVWLQAIADAIVDCTGDDAA